MSRAWPLPLHRHRPSAGVFFSLEGYGYSDRTLHAVSSLSYSKTSAGSSLCNSNSWIRFGKRGQIYF